jgi:hypothetical protein
VHDDIESAIESSRRIVNQDTESFYTTAQNFFNYRIKNGRILSPYRGFITEKEKNDLIDMLSPYWDSANRGQNLYNFLTQVTRDADTYSSIRLKIQDSLKAGIRLVFVPGVMNPEYFHLAREKEKEGTYILPQQYKGYDLPEVHPDGETTSIDTVDLFNVPNLAGHQFPPGAGEVGLTLDNVRENISYIKLADLALYTRSYVGNTSIGMEWLSQEGHQPWGEEVTRTDAGRLIPEFGDLNDDVLLDNYLFIEEGEEENVRQGTMRQESLYQMPKPKYELFPTPLASFEIDVECEVRNRLERDVPGEIASRTRQELDNELIRGLLGLGSPDRNGIRRHVACEAEPVKYLFDYVFPLERYSTLFLMQNEMILDSRQPVFSLLDPTRATIETMMKILLRPNEPSTTLTGPIMYEAIVQNMQSGGLDDRLAKLLRDIWPMILRMVAMAVPTMIRGQANFLDPAYKAMFEKFKENPCALPNGLTFDSLGAFVTDAPFDYGTKKIAKGFGKQGKYFVGRRRDLPEFGGQCGFYGPSNISAPQDAAGAALWAVFSMLGGNFGAKTFMPLIDTAVAIYNTATDQPTGGYGKMLGPMGILALTMPELPGERAEDKREERNCGPEEQKGKSAGGYFPLKEEKCDPSPSTVETLELCEDIKNSD